MVYLVFIGMPQPAIQRPIIAAAMTFVLWRTKIETAKVTLLDLPYANRLD